MSHRIQAGVNDHLTEKVVRAPFFLTHCSTVDLLAIAEYAIDIEYVGGFFGGVANKDRCTAFTCLIFRVFQIFSTQPQLSLQFLNEFASQNDHKYLRVFGIVCLRLLPSSSSSSTASSSSSSSTGSSSSSSSPLVVQIHKALDFGFLDYRRVRVMQPNGSIVVSTVDQVCDMLLFPSSDTTTTTTTTTSAASSVGGGGSLTSASTVKKTEFLGLSMPMIPTRKQIMELYPKEKEHLLHA